MGKAKYARVHTKDHTGKRRRLTLLITGENDQWLRGWQLDRNSERTDDLHLIHKTAITKRTDLVMNNYYGTLEEAD